MLESIKEVGHSHLRKSLRIFSVVGEKLGNMFKIRVLDYLNLIMAKKQETPVETQMEIDEGSSSLRPL